MLKGLLVTAASVLLQDSGSTVTLASSLKSQCCCVTCGEALSSKGELR